ncbi:MAG: F0F1 ATP synthase subunit B [Deltaproteobacteria bacterium]|nr:F0F1 ATP synthase subunit B [Deltaproteobacteria bacterium]MBW2394519.1 F0F1 ATP synthase subunit B [Deltaproteobacteria bacterium]
MSRRTQPFGLMAVLCLAPTAAFAAGEGGMGMVWEVVNLALLVGVLVYFARKPVLAYLSGRRDEIQGNLKGAEKLLQQAEGKLQEWSERAGQLDTEAESIRAAARKAAQQERDDIVADAEATAERIRASAGSVVERELRAARESLREDVADLATELASKILTEQVNDEDRLRLVDEFITKVEHGETH